MTSCTKMLSTTSTCEICKGKAAFILQVKYGAGPRDYDTYVLCVECAKAKKKEADRWMYNVTFTSLH